MSTVEESRRPSLRFLYHVRRGAVIDLLIGVPFIGIFGVFPFVVDGGLAMKITLSVLAGLFLSVVLIVSIKKLVAGGEVTLIIDYHQRLVTYSVTSSIFGEPFVVSLDRISRIKLVEYGFGDRHQGPICVICVGREEEYRPGINTNFRPKQMAHYLSEATGLATAQVDSEEEYDRVKCGHWRRQ